MKDATGWLQRVDNLNILKNMIEKQKPENIFCKVYINYIGFIWKQKRNFEYSVGEALG